MTENMTKELLPSEPPLHVERPLPGLLVQGFKLALRNWPCLVWVYAVNLLFGLLAAVPFATGLASYLDHSVAAQKIAGTIDLASLGELAIHLREAGFFAMAMQTAAWLHLLQLLVLFVLFAGTVFIFVSAEPPRLSVLLREGIAYFWRFLGAAILAGSVATVILGFLLGIRALLLARANAIYVERQMFLYSMISAAVVLLAGLLVRLWWDLVEVYIVRNAMDGERRIRHAFLPSLRLLFRHFFRLFGSFLLTGAAAVSALALFLYFWKMLPAHQVWIAALLAQLGLFLLLAGRFWQRGLEVVLVMAADPPRIARAEIAAEERTATVEEEAPVPSVQYSAGLSEPTLRELVQKLRTEPWANRELQASDPTVSLLERHNTKCPLGASSDGEPGPAEPAETPLLLEDPEKLPDPNQKPK